MVKSKVVLRVAIWVLVLLSACKKEPESPKIVFDIYDKGPQEFGSVSALKNGIKWEGTGYTGNLEAAFRNGESGGFQCYTFFDNNYKELYIIEHMMIRNIPLKRGKYRMRPYRPFSNDFKEGEAVFFYAYMEHDVTVNEFNLKVSVENFVEVTHVDSTHLEGRFDALCEGEHKIRGVSHVYRFTNGKFNIRFDK
jgi:hypothetical protein